MIHPRVPNLVTKSGLRLYTASSTVKDDGFG